MSFCRKIVPVIAILPIFLFEAKSASAAVIYQEKSIVKPSVIVSATIGIPKMTLWGYTSAGSVVELTGIGVSQTTISDPTGHYSFDLIFLPNSNTFPELCVTSIDTEKHATAPTCIPPIPQGNYFYNVGPVILPPTIGLGSPQTNPGSQVSAQGTTIPDSTIEIKLARPDTKKGILGFRLVKPALAYYIPSYTVKADANGKYSFNMPITEGVTWRVFATTEYQGGKSPKSNTLKFETLTPISFVLKSTLGFLSSLTVWPKIIILELLLILILAAASYIVLHQKKRKENDKVKVQPLEVDQNYSNLVERYQDFLSARKSNF